MTDLSPAAQAVLTAITRHEYALDPADIPMEAARMASVAAAALRAAADEVAPEEQEQIFIEERPWDVELCSAVDIRQELLAIAAELKAFTTENQ